MNKKGLFIRNDKDPASIKVALTATVAVWTAVVVLVIAGMVFLFERPSHALGSAPGASIPQIILEPDAGASGTEVIVLGQGWTPGSTILIFLVAPGQSQPATYATSSAIADAQGRINAGFTVPSDPLWQGPGRATVVVRDIDHGVSARAAFNVMRLPVQPTPTPTARPEPTATATLVPTWTPSPTPTPTPQPRIPTAITTADLHVRSGPGTVYQVLGALRKGQSARVTGVSADRNWWQIQFSGAPDGRGWISAYYVTAQDTQDVPVVQAPPPPPTPTPTPTPIPTSTPTPPPQPLIITGWRGEYFANKDLRGDPVLVRNDPDINFDWGTGSPGPGVPADNFSARWTRTVYFKAGTYRFFARVDDGVRLWVDGKRVIDQWHDAAVTTYTADVNLNRGSHDLKMEYYEHEGGAIAQLTWERLQDYPAWKGEYYANRNLKGDPVLVRNDPAINFDWGTGSPGPGVPADNFSVRWTRTLYFKDGTYRFQIKVDDGVRLWVDGKQVIDSWHDGSSRLVQKKHHISQGRHRIKVEYYEHKGGALIDVKWKRL